MSVPAIAVPVEPESIRAIIRGIAIDCCGVGCIAAVVWDFLSGSHGDPNTRLVLVSLASGYLGVGIAGVTALVKTNR